MADIPREALVKVQCRSSFLSLSVFSSSELVSGMFSHPHPLLLPRQYIDSSTSLPIFNLRLGVRWKKINYNYNINIRLFFFLSFFFFFLFVKLISVILKAFSDTFLPDLSPPNSLPPHAVATCSCIFSTGPTLQAIRLAKPPGSLPAASPVQAWLMHQ